MFLSISLIFREPRCVICVKKIDEPFTQEFGLELSRIKHLHAQFKSCCQTEKRWINENLHCDHQNNSLNATSNFHSIQCYSI